MMRLGLAGRSRMSSRAHTWAMKAQKMGRGSYALPRLSSGASRNKILQAFTGQPKVFFCFLHFHIVDPPISRIVTGPSAFAKSVDLADGSSANGTPVQMWSSSSTDGNQQWQAQQVRV